MSAHRFVILAGVLFGLQLAGPPSSAWAQARSFKGQNLAGRDFARQELEGADFSGARLRGASFRQANLRGANLAGADVAGANFDGADLSFANLEGARGPVRIDAANLSGANLRGVELDGSLDRAVLAGAKLEGADLRYVTGAASAKLGGAAFNQATRWPPGLDPDRVGAVRATASPEPASPTDRGGRPATIDPPRPAADTGGRPAGEVGRTTSVTTRSLRGQDLSRRDLRQQNFDEADLEGANLSFAMLSGASLRRASLRDARLGNASFRGADLTGADLRGADLASAVFVDAKLREAKLDGQTLVLAGAPDSFDKIKDLPYGIRDHATGLGRPDLHNGSLTFQRADLRRTRITGNLKGVDFRGADLRGADLTAAENLHEAILQSAVYDAGTRWAIDPAEMRAKRGEDLPPVAAAGGRSQAGGKPFVGQWVIEGDGAAGASERTFIRIAGDGVYAWDSGADRPMTTGVWEANAAGLILRGAEGGQDLTLVLQDAETLTVRGSGGGRNRTAFRLPAS